MKGRRIAFFLAAVAVLAVLILALNKGKNETAKVGIIEPFAHIAITDITNGIRDGIPAVESKRFEILVKNANGDASTIPQILAQYRDAGVSIFVPIFTQTAQVTKSTVVKGNIVFAAVTDPVSAQLLTNPAIPEGNITGVSDLWPISAQFELIREILPNAKNVGILFDPNDPGSSVTMPLIRAQTKQKGFELVEMPVSNVTEVAQALPILHGKIDCLFTANDVTVTKAFPALVAYAMENKTPLFAGDYSSVQRGAIAAIGQNYYNVGKEAGGIISAIANGTKVAQIPVRYTQGGDLYLNSAAADKMGVHLSETLKKRAKTTYTEITDGTEK